MALMALGASAASATYRARAYAASAGTTSSRSTTRCVDFVCKGCTNAATCGSSPIEDQKTYWGDKCSDRYRRPAKIDKQPMIADLVAYRRERLIAPYEAATRTRCRPRITMGIPLSMYT